MVEIEKPEPSRDRPRRDSTTSKAKRPVLPDRSDTVHSHYVEMLLNQDEIPKVHTALAAFFVWLLLAGFLVFPGTFTSIQDTIREEHDKNWEEEAQEIIDSIKNLPLLIVAAVACAVGILGMAVLSFLHLRNYVWLLNRLFLPGVTNSLAGLISTLVGVYTQQGGTWSITAKVTAAVEATIFVVGSILFLLFSRVLLRRVKKRHESYYEDGQTTKKDKKKKKKKPERAKPGRKYRESEEAALEPGSIV